jgi:hypothetical protein
MPKTPQQSTDLNGYATLRDTKLASLPGVHRITSTIVMKRIVDNRPLPVPGTRYRPAGLQPGQPPRLL